MASDSSSEDYSCDGSCLSEWELSSRCSGIGSSYSHVGSWEDRSTFSGDTDRNFSGDTDSNFSEGTDERSLGYSSRDDDTSPSSDYGGGSVTDEDDWRSHDDSADLSCGDDYDDLSCCELERGSGRRH